MLLNSMPFVNDNNNNSLSGNDGVVFAGVPGLLQRPITSQNQTASGSCRTGIEQHHLGHQTDHPQIFVDF